jgi:hypothetical protein
MIALTLDLSRVTIRLAKRNALPAEGDEVVGNWRIVDANKTKSKAAEQRNAETKPRADVKN